MLSAEEECVSLLLATLTTDGKQTAGLTLAARLTEDPSVTVAVLEAGEHNIGEPLIDVPGQFGQTFGNLKVFSSARDSVVNRKSFLIRAGSLTGLSLPRLKSIL